MLDQRAQLAGKTAVVIGGAAGIGAAITLALADAGVDVAFCDRNATALEETQRALRERKRRAFAEVFDATDTERLVAFYRNVAREFERLDILVNVVGGVLQQPFMSETPADCAADIQRNYGYAITSMREAVKLMRRSGRGGSIVSFTTIEAHRGAPGFAVYAGAKAALTNFSKALAVELGPENIRVNLVAPDTTPSEGNFLALPPATRDSMAKSPPEWMDAALKMYIPLGRAPSTDDLANAVLFLASDLARSISGITLHVDGGTAAAAGMVNWPGQGYLPVPLADVQRKLFGP